MIIQSGRGTPGEKQNLSFTTGKDDAQGQIRDECRC